MADSKLVMSMKKASRELRSKFLDSICNEMYESCWKDGFDPKGAEHYNHRIVGKTSFIGAVEVSSVLSYLHIDSTVVQFIQCFESRSKLGPFVWAYFTDEHEQQQGDSKSDPVAMIDLPSSRMQASRLLHQTKAILMVLVSVPLMLRQ